MSEQQQQQQQTPLALPAPLDVETTKLELNQTLRLDRLGPMIINSDGTVSRISNWAEMSEIERERTTRMLVKRNKVRLATLSDTVPTPTDADEQGPSTAAESTN